MMLDLNNKLQIMGKCFFLPKDCGMSGGRLCGWSHIVVGTAERWRRIKGEGENHCLYWAFCKHL